ADGVGAALVGAAPIVAPADGRGGARAGSGVVAVRAAALQRRAVLPARGGNRRSRALAADGARLPVRARTVVVSGGAAVASRVRLGPATAGPPLRARLRRLVARVGRVPRAVCPGVGNRLGQPTVSDGVPPRRRQAWPGGLDCG